MTQGNLFWMQKTGWKMAIGMNRPLKRAEGSVASACQGMVNFRELFGKFFKAQPGGQ